MATDNRATSNELFEKWIAARRPAYGTIESWRYVFSALQAHFDQRSAASILPEEAQEWVRGLVTPTRSAGTVKRTWLNAAMTVFTWAVEQRLVARNPFAGIRVTLPRKAKLREQAFRSDEIALILRGASAIKSTHRPHEAAKRWVPWVCAYTGARVGEIAQLRGVDVLVRDGVHALRITPEAGPVKTNEAREVPLHEHLISQGFLEFVKAKGPGPLFYKPRRSMPSASNDPKAVTKPPGAQARQRLADWVRELGVTDQHVRPNHAWRHTFKQIADRAGISERTSDEITGHAHKSVGASYGRQGLIGMALALKKFPRYSLTPVNSADQVQEAALQSSEEAASGREPKRA